MQRECSRHATRRVRNFVFGVNLPVSQIKDAIKSK